MRTNEPKVIAIYLPQFHPIPENDEWWGAGFTEWRNVARARPRFRGHNQPQIPADLGFYDLRLQETRKAQAELAFEHGIHGFCYYHYWFNGKMLLERPFNEVLESGQPDFPFCLCWANENWTRRWDGQDNQVLIAQNYSTYDPQAHIAWLARAFADKRYISVDGKPLWLIWRAASIPKLDYVIDAWRKAARSLGFPDVFLCAVRGGHNRQNEAAFSASGFDSVLNVQPGALPTSGYHWYVVRKKLKRLLPNVASKLLAAMGATKFAPNSLTYSKEDYSTVMRKAIDEMLKPQQLPVFPCVFPSWDNSARRSVGALVIQNDDAELYGSWLRECLRHVSRAHPPQTQFVFVNAWNEWAEGCHLEPDLTNGRRFLEATRSALLAERLGVSTATR
jgi:lipopolysaccharide biosynthesis protein